MRTIVALVALSLLVLQASGEEGMYLMYVCMYGTGTCLFFAESCFNSFYGFLQDLDRSAPSVLSLICVSKMDGGRDRKF